MEEQALLTLCAAVLPLDASRVFLDCVGTLQSADGRLQSVQLRAVGTWSRVVILLRRVLDKHSFADAEESHRLSMVTSVTAALSSTQALNDAHTMAILITLSRWLFVPAGVAKDVEGSGSDHSEHEKWLKDLLRTNGGKVVKGMIKALDDVVQLEPLRILRTYHRVFSANKQHLPYCGDYLVRVRTRISDLDPLRHPDGHPHSRQNNSIPEESEAARKAQESVTKFVKEFAKTKGKLPASLIRQMNFHRYHFRSNTLPVLLNPDFEPTGIPGAETDKDGFDEHRINMLKVMAFKRKDQAVTTVEAQNAIKAIVEAKKARAAVRLENARTNGNGLRGAVVDIPKVSDRDSLSQVTESMVKHKLRAVFGTKEEQRSNEMSLESHQDVVNHVRQAVEKTGDKKSLATAATDILQGILNALAANDDITQMDSDDVNAEELYTKYRAWWSCGGPIVKALLSALLSDKILRSYQKPIQYQMFALSCMRSHLLPPKHIIGLAVLSCIASLWVGNPDLSDLGFIALSESPPKLVPLPLIMFESLPLSAPRSVCASLSFALHCTCLLRTAEERKYALCTQASALSPSGASASPESFAKNERISLPIAPAESLLRWALTSPWRLLAAKDDSGEESSGTALFIASSLLKKIAYVSKSKQWKTSPRRALQEWLKTEYRCGWGRPKHVHRVLQMFSVMGVRTTQIVGETSSFIAMRPQAANAPASWIAQGMEHFADESTDEHCGKVDANGDRTLPSYMSTCVARCGAAAGGRMLDLVANTRQWYFHSCTEDEVRRHFSGFIVPYFWPLSSRQLKYFMVSLDRVLCDLDDTQPHEWYSIFLIPNLVLKWSSLGNDLQQLNVCSPGMKSSVSLAKRLRHVVRLLTSRDVASVHGQQTQQIPASQSALVASSLEEYPQHVGLAVCLQVLKRHEDITQESGTVDHRASNACSTLLAIGSTLQVVDVMDTAIISATFLPFTDSFSDTVSHEETLAEANHLLRIFLANRLRLSYENQQPAWALTKLETNIQSPNDCRAVLLKWFGEHNHQREESTDGYLSKSLAISVCMARLFAAVNQIPKDILSEFLTSLTYENASAALIPNILTIYQMLTLDRSEYAAEKLQSTTLERLFNSRESLASALLNVVDKIVSEMHAPPDHTRENMIGRILLNFPERAHEVKLFLQARLDLRS